MRERMSRFGVGPVFALGSLACLSVAIGLHLWRPEVFRIEIVPGWVPIAIGVVLIAVAVPVCVVAVRTVMRAYERDGLCTSGVYRLCRHPVYAVWVLLLAPGVLLLFRSWVLLAVPAAMYAIARLLVRREEAYLERRFGDAYREYRRRVPAIVPFARAQRRTR